MWKPGIYGGCRLYADKTIFNCILLLYSRNKTVPLELNAISEYAFLRTDMLVKDNRV